MNFDTITTLSLPGYKEIEKVVEIPDSYVFRGKTEKSDMPVLIKLLKKECTQDQMIKFAKAFKHYQPYKVQGIISPIDMIIHYHNLCVIYRDEGKVFLPMYFKKRGFDSETFLLTSIHIVKVIKDIHNVLDYHGDLRPGNILIDENTKEICIIGVNDFEVGFEKAQLSAKEQMIDAFKYTPPEQTGRISWQIDNRSDLYSLGVVFYEMLCKQVPFISSNPLVRIHSHIAKVPAPLQDHNPNIPLIFNEIIQKLLNKSAEERYQSASG